MVEIKAKWSIKGGLFKVGRCKDKEEKQMNKKMQ